MKRRWAESMRVTEEGGVNAESIKGHMTAAVHLLFKWLETTRMVHHIAITAQQEQEAENQEAQQKHNEHHAKAEADENVAEKSPDGEKGQQADGPHRQDELRKSNSTHKSPGNGHKSARRASTNKTGRAPTFHAPVELAKDAVDTHDDGIDTGESTLNEMLSKYADRNRNL